MGFTFEKTESYILTYFINRPKVLEIISEIHDYLTAKDDVHFNRPITYFFGYTIIKSRSGARIFNTDKFFTSTLYSNGTYLLHLLSPENAEVIQREVDKKFKGNIKKNKNVTKKVHLNMDLVESFSQIKSYIDLAYEQRKSTFK